MFFGSLQCVYICRSMLIWFSTKSLCWSICQSRFRREADFDIQEENIVFNRIAIVLKLSQSKMIFGCLMRSPNAKHHVAIQLWKTYSPMVQHFRRVWHVQRPFSYLLSIWPINLGSPNRDIAAPLPDLSRTLLISNTPYNLCMVMSTLAISDWCACTTGLFLQWYKSNKLSGGVCIQSLEALQLSNNQHGWFHKLSFQHSQAGYLIVWFSLYRLQFINAEPMFNSRESMHGKFHINGRIRFWQVKRTGSRWRLLGIHICLSRRSYVSPY